MSGGDGFDHYQDQTYIIIMGRKVCTEKISGDPTGNKCHMKNFMGLWFSQVF